MSTTQDQALWELCRQGLHRLAEEAEGAWQRGQRFVPDGRTRVAREVAQLIDLCNWEVGSRQNRRQTGAA